MTFNQINYFLAVADQLSFTKAAASLFVTQSTLSRSIAALENEIGAPLLHRDFHTVTLTAAGEILYKEMKATMRSINATISRVQAAGKASTDRFVLGILEGQSVEEDVLFAIRNLSDKFPHLNVDIRRMYHSQIVEEILSCRLDIAQTIISDQTVLDDSLDCLTLRNLSNFLLAQKKDPVLQGDFSITSLRGRNLIVPENIHPGLSAAIQELQSTGISMNIKRAPDLETQSLWMEAGMGVYIGNENSVIYTSIPFRPINAVPMPELPKNKEVLIWNRHAHPNILEDFLSFIRANINYQESSF